MGKVWQLIAIFGKETKLKADPVWKAGYRKRILVLKEIRETKFKR